MRAQIDMGVRAVVANRVGWKGVRSLEADFQRALRELRQMPRIGIDNAFRPILSRSSVDRLLDSDWETKCDRNGKLNRYSDDLKEKLIYCIDSPKIVKLYDSIADRVQKTSDKNMIVDNFVGDYTYFSHFYQRASQDYKLASGEIAIYRDQDDNPSFSHRSGNWKNQEPEHVGFVYKSGSNLFLVGTTVGAIKSMTIRVSSNPAVDPMIGFNLSVRASGQFDPFSSKFIIISNKNESLILELMENEEKFNELLDSQSPDYLWL